ncbi:hypothetical protein AVEN_264373-1 [Araneus ventricosus]|uniref:Uncharacterized protein n=1 Tax=Araneus ventricosus TaxID=182803 RepID=A0A4Y2H7U7_ARAVE|nr:hypothetical protein AVEN_264373-1 [Araneus ventricosus]
MLRQSMCNDEALLTRGTIIAKNQDVEPFGKRPDFVFQMGKEIFIIDVTIPFENRYESFDDSRQEKLNKYLLAPWEAGTSRTTRFSLRFFSRSFLKSVMSFRDHRAAELKAGLFNLSLRYGLKNVPKRDVINFCMKMDLIAKE